MTYSFSIMKMCFYTCKYRLAIIVEICETNVTSSRANFLQSTNRFYLFRTSNTLFDISLYITPRAKTLASFSCQRDHSKGMISRIIRLRFEALYTLFQSQSSFCLPLKSGFTSEHIIDEPFSPCKRGKMLHKNIYCRNISLFAGLRNIAVGAFKTLKKMY